MERTDSTDIEAFLTVAQTGSFTKAAEMLASSKSNIGKAVQRLEARLGTPLVPADHPRGPPDRGR